MEFRDQFLRARENEVHRAALPDPACPVLKPGIQLAMPSLHLNRQASSVVSSNTTNIPGPRSAHVLLQRSLGRGHVLQATTLSFLSPNTPHLCLSLSIAHSHAVCVHVCLSLLTSFLLSPIPTPTISLSLFPLFS